MTRWSPIAAGFLVLAGLALWTTPAAAPPLPPFSPLGIVQWECLELRVSACLCPGIPPKPCLRVSYWEPVLLIDTEAFTGIGRAKEARFHEARVWPFPLSALLGVFSFPCSRAGAGLSPFNLLPYYLSDIDPLWRTGDLPPLPSGFLGTWGLLRPRSGWGAGGSDPVTSALACYRAIDVAASPGGHVVLRPSGIAASTGNKMNLGSPKLTGCLRPGAPHIGWEQGAGSPTGHYLWVYWVPRSCCITPDGFFFSGLPAGVTDLLSIPGLPGLPDLPSIPGLPKLPGLPGLGGDTK